MSTIYSVSYDAGDSVEFFATKKAAMEEAKRLQSAEFWKDVMVESYDLLDLPNKELYARLANGRSFCKKVSTVWAMELPGEK